MKLTYKRIVTQLLVLTLSIGLAACGSAGGNAGNAGTSSTANTDTTTANEGTSGGGEEITIKIASTVASAEIEANNTPMAVGINTWIETVEQESGGTISVRIFPDSQLASGSEAIVGGVQSGAFEMAQMNTGSWGEYTDAFASLNVPYLFLDFGEVHAVMDSEYGEEMLQQIRDEVRVEPLCYLDIGFRHITNSRGEIKTPADMSGLKIRTMTDQVQISAMEDLGASVTPLAISELFSAMQQKLVDAQENPLSTIYTNKYYEVQDYLTLSGHSYTTTIFFMNQDFLAGLSDEHRAAVDAANEAATVASRTILAEAEAEYRELLATEGGMTVYEPTQEELGQFQDAVAPTWDKVRAELGNERFERLLDTVEAVR